MLIDVHGHIGQNTPDTEPASRVSTYAGVCNLDYVLVSNRDGAYTKDGAANLDETAANVACLEACRAYTRLAPLYWVRAGRLDSNANAMAGALATEPFAGALFSPADVGFDAADPELDAYLEVLARGGRPALFCIRDDDRAVPTKVHQLGQRHRRVPLILCPCGGPSLRAAVVDVVGAAQRKQDATLYLDTSHAGPAEVAATIDAVGVDRVLYGSDACHHGDAHIPRQIALLDELRQTLGPESFAQVAGGNAARVFRLRTGTVR